eukprot:15479117-Alexandrium_andersonii.AAC.1
MPGALDAMPRTAGKGEDHRFVAARLSASRGSMYRPSWRFRSPWSQATKRPGGPRPAGGLRG